MSKRRITLQQANRIKKNQAKHSARIKHQLQKSADDKLTFNSDQKLIKAHEQFPVNQQQNHDDQNSTQQTGLVISHFGTYVDIEDKNGKIFRCNLRQNLGTLVVGDIVIWQTIDSHSKDENAGVILAIQDRQSLLSRPISNEKTKAIAANVDQVVVVIAVQPQPATTLIDSYLVAIENNNMQPVIVLNKIDLLDLDAENNMTRLLDIYRALNYPVFTLSATIQFGLNDLQQQLAHKTSIFVGQSGVGKSSVLASLLPHHNFVIGENESVQNRGLHTTTAARLYHLPCGGNVIDSPGVREFMLWDLSLPEIAQGFIEFRDYLGLCKFRDCNHDKLENCVIQEAASIGAIHPSRLQSYLRIMANITGK